MTKSIVLKNEQVTEKLASCFANGVVPGTVCFLQGELGSGKTTFVRGFLRGLKFKGSVKSPTYTLVEEYDFSWGRVFHFDLYRLTQPDELDFIGIREYFALDTIVLVEWPERGLAALPDPDLIFNFHILNEGRKVEVEPKSARGKEIVSELELELENDNRNEESNDEGEVSSK